jgi:hypothetical protein
VQTQHPFHFFFTGSHIPPTEANTRNVSLVGSDSSKRNGGTYLKDVSKPDGEACREDGTLKDASEMDWSHSPSAPNFRELEDPDLPVDGNTRQEDSEPESELSYLSNGRHDSKKRKNEFSDEENTDSNLDELAPRKNSAKTAGSSKRHQFTSHRKKIKKKNIDREGDPLADSEREKEDDTVVMEKEDSDVVMEDTNKVSFCCLCNACVLT